VHQRQRVAGGDVWAQVHQYPRLGTNAKSIDDHLMVEPRRQLAASSCSSRSRKARGDKDTGALKI